MRYDFQIYSPKGSHAFNYVLEFVFKPLYGFAYEWIKQAEQWNGNAILINYSSQAIENAIQIQPNNYLFDSSFFKFPEIEVFEWKSLPVFFKTNGKIPFDI